MVNTALLALVYEHAHPTTLVASVDFVRDLRIADIFRTGGERAGHLLAAGAEYTDVGGDNIPTGEELHTPEAVRVAALICLPVCLNCGGLLPPRAPNHFVTLVLGRAIGRRVDIVDPRCTQDSGPFGPGYGTYPRDGAVFRTAVESVTTWYDAVTGTDPAAAGPWTVRRVAVPQQPRDDCGPWVVAFTDALLRGAPLANANQQAFRDALCQPGSLFPPA